MPDLISRFPINLRRSDVSAIRVFPKGCGRFKVNPNPNLNLIVELESNGKEIGNESVSDMSSCLKVIIEESKRGESRNNESLEGVKVDGNMVEQAMAVDSNELVNENLEELGNSKKIIEENVDGESFDSKKIIDEIVEETNSKKLVNGNVEKSLSSKKNNDENVEESLSSKKDNDENVELSLNLKKTNDGNVEESSSSKKNNNENVEESLSSKKNNDENVELSLNLKKTNDRNVEEDSKSKKLVNGNVDETCKSKKNNDENVDETSSEKLVNWNVDKEPCNLKRGINDNVKDPSSLKKLVNRNVKEMSSDTSSTRFVKTSKVSAIRVFPIGCGRNVSVNNKARSSGVGPIASSESKAMEDELEVGTIVKNVCDDVMKYVESCGNLETEGEELVGEINHESDNDEVAKSVKVKSLSGEKKESTEVEVSSFKKLKKEAKGKEVSKDDIVESPKMKSSEVKIENVVKKKAMKKTKLSGQESTHMKKVRSEDMLEENKEKKSSYQSLVVKESLATKGSSGITTVTSLGKVVAKKSVAKDIILSKSGKSMKRKLQDEEVDESLEAYGDKLIVQALMSAKNCPWKQDKKSRGLVSHSAAARTKRQKATNSLSHSAPQHRNMIKAEDNDDESQLLDTNNEKALTIYNGSRDLCVMMTPSVPSRKYLKECSDGSTNKEIVDRNMVKKALKLYQLVSRKLLQEEEKLRGILSEDKTKPKRVDLEAAGILKKNNECVNCGGVIIGPVPGVEVGDEFHFRVELSIIGLHRPFQAGIDFSKINGTLLATSIVASGGYPDDVDSSDVLIYSGSGGNASASKNIQAGDQKLERGNLALKNCIDAQTPVRVIYGSKESIKTDVRGSKPKLVSTFTYDGLYLVEGFWPEVGKNEFTVFKFQLRRIAGQPEISLKEIKKTRNSKVREGLVVNDISGGKESMPICAININDNERPMPFNYINKVIYPSSHIPKPSIGCDCKNGCSDAKKCACAIKNGGELPYNFNGAIVEAKVIVYECGPNCKCPPSCYNRVSQHGIQLPLELFKTDKRGWGVRSLYSIPSGTFVCEYVGEMLDEVEAESRVNDEYLFDIGNNYDDRSLWDGLPSYIPSMHSGAVHESGENGGFTIDAAKCGNVGRFINHSCTPNLYAQNVLYDHDEKKMPHIMFFASENIPPLKELTYHYNYTLDHVRDEHGNIKKKNCYCGSPECSGRLY